MVSIKDIASDLGVTAATVSNALNGKGRVSEELVKRIRQRAEHLGYRPSSAAIALQSGRSNIIGLVMPDLTNPLFPHIAKHLSISAERRGFAVLIADSRNSGEEQDQAINRLISRGVDGLVVVPQKGTSPRSPQLQPVPIAIINTASDPNNSVSADHKGGGALVAQHIAELGHRSIVIVGGDPVSDVQQDRIAGMLLALPDAARTEILWGKSSIEQLAEKVRSGASAILTTSDLIALSAHSHLLRAGIKVPDEVSLTGFDDMAIAATMYPTLTSVAQNTETIAETAVSLLESGMDGQSPDAPGQTVAMRLIVRNSSKSPKPPSNKETHQ